LFKLFGCFCAFAGLGYFLVFSPFLLGGPSFFFFRLSHFSVAFRDLATDLMACLAREDCRVATSDSFSLTLLLFFFFFFCFFFFSASCGVERTNRFRWLLMKSSSKRLEFAELFRP